MDGWIHGPVRWLADAGCPADLIGLNVMTAGDIGMIEQANGAICFNTANGDVRANPFFPLHGSCTRGGNRLYVLEQSFAVLPIGRYVCPTATPSAGLR